MFTFKQVLMTLAAFVFLAACNKQNQNEVPTPDQKISLGKGQSLIPGAYIITYNASNNRIAFRSEDYDQRSRTVLDYTTKLVQKFGVTPDRITQTYNTALQGFAANLTDKEVAALKADPRIASVEPDAQIKLDYEIVPSSNANIRDYIPYGIERVGRANGSGRTAWVLDTGVDLDHPDLNVNRSLSRSFISGAANGDDDNGHGTHCAGTIAAVSNNFGVIGVAYNATVVGIKVFNSAGGGSTSITIRGIDYVTSRARSGDVANMSFGFPPNTALDNAVRRLADRGVLVAIAAGNSRSNVNTTSPGRLNYRNVVSVSAMDSRDRFASFSNYGSGVDYCAPGVDVWSTWPGGQYNRISGTSMAAPHVAGLMLLRGSTNLRTNGTVIGDPDGRPDRIAVR